MPTHPRARTSAPAEPQKTVRLQAPEHPGVPPTTPAAVLAAGPAAWLEAVLWHHRHAQGSTLICEITADDIAAYVASLEHTKQRAIPQAVVRGARLIVGVVEAGSVLLDKNTREIVSMGNEIRPCESTTAGQELAEKARLRAAFAQKARDMAQTLLGHQAAGTLSESTIREAAQLLAAGAASL